MNFTRALLVGGMTSFNSFWGTRYFVLKNNHSGMENCDQAENVIVLTWLEYKKKIN